ncbi:MAG: S1C family serine protease, partial [Arenimonas sp.]
MGRAILKLLMCFIVGFSMIANQAIYAQEKSLNPSEIFRIASKSVVTIITFDKNGVGLSQGSGVVVYPNVVVSNCHVMKGASSIEVRNTKLSYVATIRHVDPKRDLCSLNVSAPNLPTAQIGSSRNLQVGANVYAIGSPKGYELTFSDGLLSAFRNSGDSQRLQITAPISRGSSGGGLFDSKARLIGITSSGRDDGQQLNFAIPVEWIAELPQRHELSLAASSKTVTEKSPERLRIEKEILAFADYLKKNDSEAFDSIKDDWLKIIEKIASTLPESQWPTEARYAYYELRNSYVAKKNSAQKAPAPAPAKAKRLVDPRWKLISEEIDASKY